MKATLSTEATTSADRWLNLWNTPDLAARTTIEWPRAAAHLCRQALEASLDELWRAKLPEMSDSSMRAQLICLPTYLSDDDSAGHVAYTWSALSNACHHQIYELSPTSTELLSWIETSRQFHDTVESTFGVK